MAAKDDDQIGKIAEKVDNLAKELSDIRKDLEILDSISDIIEKTDAIDSVLKDMQSAIEPVSKLDDLVTSVNEIKKIDKKLDGLATSKESEVVNKTMEDIATSLKGFESDIQTIKESKENEVIIKKIDDILLSLVDSDVIDKKLDDLQGYIAGLSGIEEKVEDLSARFAETNEIVGIIVRQLDDIERKYNLSIDKISETAELVLKIAAERDKLDSAAKSTGKKSPTVSETEDTPEERKTPVSKASLPSTIDALMSNLLSLVTPQTEAKDMAESLEEVRDELTPMITVHTPVLFQFGKKARELKSYPPTATLNENDIASLNKEIKSWASKLKEIAKSS
ncbi:hypothetical protein E4H12_00305 [Candidatus Thorarchaeota archaeon]|nr:MAG: hypothetical protein E4H12_00305 [Candidatus Thorarchaeota archaeon]